MSIAPSGGMLKKMFDPATFKKKMKTARGYAKSPGENSKKFDTKFAGKSKPTANNGAAAKNLKLMSAEED